MSPQLQPIVYRRAWRRRVRRIRRHPLCRAVVAAAAVIAAGYSMASASRQVADARRSWGESRPVVVATHALAAGDVVTADDVTVASWPAGLAPQTAMGDPPVGRTVSASIEEGEPIVTARLAPAGVTGLAALVPAGWRALAVPVTTATVPLQIGDRVDLLATFDLEVDTGGAPTFPVAADAVVLEVADQAVTVAVPEADATRVAFALSTGSVIPALRGAD